MKMHATLYHPDHEAPDYGGFHGRFGRLWREYHRFELTRLQTLCIAMIGALAGLVAAALWVV